MKKALGKNWLGAGVSLLLAIVVLAVPASWAAEPVFSGGAAGRAVPPEAEACKGCHEAYVQSYLKSIHGQTQNSKGPDCQSCHGDATAHMKAGGGKGVGGVLSYNDKKVPASKKSATCMACHDGNRHLAFWQSGKHNRNDVACTSCHLLHGAPGAGATMAFKSPNPNIAPMQTTQRTLEYETCTSCHKQIRSQLLKTSHHPIIEGRITCSSCHNAHGALSPAMVKSESIPALCTSCHAEKRGPFIWEHPPVEENCLTCHNSHGSNHARLLAEKAPNVCQNCHDAARHPGTVYSGDQGFFGPKAPSTRLVIRGCVNCHFTIHGSNAPDSRGKFFTR